MFFFLHPRSLYFKLNNGVSQWGSDVNLAQQVQLDGRLRVRKRGGKNLNKDRKRKDFAIFGASVFCFTEPKCFRLRLRKNQRQGKQQTEPKSSLETVILKIKKDDNEIHSEEVKNLSNDGYRRSRKGDNNRSNRKRKRICPSLEFEEPGSYKLVVEKGKEVHFWDFKIQPSGDEYVTDIRRPRRTFADGKTSLASVTKICSNQTNIVENKNRSKRRLRRVKAATYQWKSDIEIDADIDLVDSSQLELPKNSLQGNFFSKKNLIAQCL